MDDRHELDDVHLVQGETQMPILLVPDCVTSFINVLLAFSILLFRDKTMIADNQFLGLLKETEFKVTQNLA